MSSVKVELPAEITKDLVEAHIKAAVVAALAKNPEDLVRGVVEAALRQKRNSYDSASIWDQQLNEAIRASAEGAFREWLDEQKPLFKKLFKERLGKEYRRIIDALAEKLIGGLGSNLYVNVSFRDPKEI